MTENFLLKWHHVLQFRQTELKKNIFNFKNTD